MIKAVGLVILWVCAASITARAGAVEHKANLFPSATIVRAYVYAQPEKGPVTLILDPDFRTTNNLAAPSGGIVLTSAQVAKLKGALLRAPPATANNAESNAWAPEAMTCAFDPHHAFVFLDAKGKIIGTVDICFECYALEYRAPGLRENADDDARATVGIPPWDRDIDYPALEKLVTGLGLPIHPVAADFKRLRKRSAP